MSTSSGGRFIDTAFVPLQAEGVSALCEHGNRFKERSVSFLALDDMNDSVALVEFESCIMSLRILFYFKSVKARP